MSEELESCPLCGALPADQVDSDAVKQRVRNRYKFSRQGLLDDCASREAAQRIVEWADNGKLADDEWLVERNETAIIAICRALLSSPRVEEVRRMREALEQIAEPMGVLPSWARGAERKRIATEALAALSPTDGAPVDTPKVRTPAVVPREPRIPAPGSVENLEVSTGDLPKQGSNPQHDLRDVVIVSRALAIVMAECDRQKEASNAAGESPDKYRHNTALHALWAVAAQIGELAALPPRSE